MQTKIKLPRKFVYAFIVSYASAFLIGVASILYANNAVQESNQKWCDLLVPLDDAYHSAPIQSPIGKKIAQEIHRLRTGFEC